MNKSHADLISVCEKEFLKIQTLEIPYVQFYDRIIKEGTLEDQKRWIALGEKVYELSKDEDMKKVIKFCLDYYKNNNKQIEILIDEEEFTYCRIIGIRVECCGTEKSRLC